MNRLTNIFKLMSDETRLRIIMLLNKEELCVCEISGILNIPQPRISQNLSKLRDMNLVEDERKEKFVYYCLKKDNMVFRDILKNIEDDIESYPQLLSDREKIKDKNIYFSQCGVNLIKKETY